MNKLLLRPPPQLLLQPTKHSGGNSQQSWFSQLGGILVSENSMKSPCRFPRVVSLQVGHSHLLSTCYLPCITEKAMVPHSSTLAWKVPWTGEPGGLQSRAAVYFVAKSRTRLSVFTFTFHFHALKKEMATHSSVLAWRIPGMRKPGGLPSMESHRVWHDCSDLAAALH